MALRVVCVGLATVDLVQRVERIPRADEKAEADAVEIAAGGPATNAAVTAAALGAEVILVTAIGAHPLGGLIRADLAANNVAVLDAAPDSARPPALSAVVVQADGRRTVVSRNAADGRATVPSAFARLVAEADVVLLDGHHPALALAAARSGRPLVVDAGSWRPVMAQVLPHATVVACSARFRVPGANSQNAMAASIRAAGVPKVAVTHGADPVRWWNGGESGRLAVPRVAAVDTTGAGDAFHGALALAVARDPQVGDLARALRYAIEVAGIRVRHPGPRSWLADPALAQLG
jgi:sugar/nucleoside kinase (ribokinase family)